MRNRIEAKKREAVEAEIRSLRERMSAELDSRIAERAARVEELTGEAKRRTEEAAVRELSELQAFGESTLKRLDEELLRRRDERLKEEATRRQARLSAEKEADERKRQAEEEALKRRAAAGDPANRLRVIIRNAQAHFARGDVEVAAKAISEGLEIDGFNAELLDLDAKVREAMASDTFSAGATGPAGAKKEKARAKAPKPKKEKPPAAAADAPVGAGRRKFPGWAFTAVAAVLISVAAVLAWLEYRPRVVERGMTLAVLPWSTGGNADLATIGNALPEVIVRTLASAPSIPDILGYSTTAAMSSLGTDPASPLVRLSYSHFLRGSVSRRDSLFTVHVELSDSSGNTLWSANFDRDTLGLFLVPYEVAHGLRAHFREPSSVGAAMEIRNTGAYLLYLEGLNALRLPDGSGIDRSIVAFNGAIGADSTLGDAWSGLAWALVARHAVSEPGPGDLLTDARAAARRSIGLLPGSGEGYLAMSRVLTEQRDFVAALSALDTAAARSPADARVPWLRGLVLFRSGQPSAADVLQKAYVLDPRNPGLLELLATVSQVNLSFERALWYRETAMHFSADTLRYLAGPVSDVILHEPALALDNARRVSSACLRLLEGDPYEYKTLYSLARLLQVSGDVEESSTYFAGLESSLRSRIKESPVDVRARMYLALVLTRTGRYAEGTAVGEAAAAADTNNIEAKYLLARVYSLQMYSPQTRTVDPEKQARAAALLKGALSRRFDNGQLCSADLYNFYRHGDIRSLIR